MKYLENQAKNGDLSLLMLPPSDSFKDPSAHTAKREKKREAALNLCSFYWR